MTRNWWCVDWREGEAPRVCHYVNACHVVELPPGCYRTWREARHEAISSVASHISHLKTLVQQSIREDRSPCSYRNGLYLQINIQKAMLTELKRIRKPKAPSRPHLGPNRKRFIAADFE